MTHPNHSNSQNQNHLNQNYSHLGKVAVLMGGSSAERNISLMSGEGVLKALQSKGVDAHAFDPSQDDLTQLRSLGFKRCFIALHGRYGEDGTVQGLLELLKIPYTGSGVMASSIAIDKVMTKQIWAAQSLPTPRSVCIQEKNIDLSKAQNLSADLGLPLIVKPPHEGSSIGVSKIKKIEDLSAAIDLALEYDQTALCEEFIDGEEVTCAVIGHKESARALPVIRISAPDGSYDYENKYFTDNVKYQCPSGLTAHEEEEIQRIVVQAYKALGCRGWGRADVMIRARDRKPFLLEMNTSPGMTSHSLVPMSARAIGISYEDLCLMVLESAALDTSR